MLILDAENNDEKRRVRDWFPPPRVSIVTLYGFISESEIARMI
jgi:hypothetical protein